jgi:hypothetical protein
MQIAPNPAMPASFYVAYDPADGTFQVNYEAPTFGLSTFTHRSDPDCDGGPGLNVLGEPSDWSPTGDGAETVSLETGGTHDYDRSWKWTYRTAGASGRRDFAASMHTTLQVDDALGPYPHIHAVVTDYKAFVRSVRKSGESIAGELATVNARTPKYEGDLTATYKADLDQLDNLEQGWLTRACSAATRRKITSDVAEQRNRLSQFREAISDLPKLAAKAIRTTAAAAASEALAGAASPVSPSRLTRRPRPGG